MLTSLARSAPVRALTFALVVLFSSGCGGGGGSASVAPVVNAPGDNSSRVILSGQAVAPGLGANPGEATVVNETCRFSTCWELALEGTPVDLVQLDARGGESRVIESTVIANSFYRFDLTKHAVKLDAKLLVRVHGSAGSGVALVSGIRQDVTPSTDTFFRRVREQLARDATASLENLTQAELTAFAALPRSLDILYNEELTEFPQGSRYASFLEHALRADTGNAEEVLAWLDFYPMREGNRWVYDVTHRTARGEETSTLTREVTGTTAVNGKTAWVLRSTSSNAQTVPWEDYYSRADQAIAHEGTTRADRDPRLQALGAMAFADNLASSVATVGISNWITTAPDFDGDAVAEVVEIKRTSGAQGWEEYFGKTGRTPALGWGQSWEIRTKGSLGKQETFETYSEHHLLGFGVGPLRSTYLKSRAHYVDGAAKEREASQSVEELTSENVRTKLFAGESRFQRLMLPHTALVYDATRRLFYASVPDQNRVVAIDPKRAEIVASYPASAPAHMAISDDGRHLYYTVKAEYDNPSDQIARIDLVSGAEDLRFSLPVDAERGALFTYHIAVRPGHSNTLLVNEFWNPGYVTVGMYVDGRRVAGPDDAVSIQNALTGPQMHRVYFGASPDVAYVVADFGLYRLGVTDSGVSTPILIAPLNSYEPLNFAGTRAFVVDHPFSNTPASTWIDLTTGSTGSIGAAGCVPIAGGSRVACTDFNGPMLVTIDLATEQLISSETVSVWPPLYAWDGGIASGAWGRLQGYTNHPLIDFVESPQLAAGQ
jgi:hypothetical protein